MRTLTLLRLILRLLREIREERRLLGSQLLQLNQTAAALLEVAAKEANYMPAPRKLEERPPRWAIGRSEADLFVAGEEVRRKLTEKLGREPLDEEFFEELEASLVTSAERKG